jgi:(p)ppGpp synthase/HD superfamily hydrolase
VPGRAYNTFNDALALMKFAHFGEPDKAGFDYAEHPKRVCAAVQAQGAPPFVQIAALMHDVPEDTRFSHNMMLELGFSPAVVELTRLLDRDESERDYNKRVHGGYDVYGAKDKDEFYYLAIRRNPWARMIKLADIADNTLDYRLEYLSVKKQIQLLHKYAFGVRLLRFEENLDFMADDWKYFPRLRRLEQSEES